MRYLHTHKTNDLNTDLTIEVLDEPGPGGAHHQYRISSAADNTEMYPTIIKFQDGPIKEFGVNGVTNEALLAIVEDRLDCFQKGPFACPENAAALEEVRTAMRVLALRTRSRIARGVEGTLQV